GARRRRASLPLLRRRADRTDRRAGLPPARRAVRAAGTSGPGGTAPGHHGRRRRRDRSSASAAGKGPAVVARGTPRLRTTCARSAAALPNPTRRATCSTVRSPQPSGAGLATNRAWPPSRWGGTHHVPGERGGDRRAVLPPQEVEAQVHAGGGARIGEQVARRPPGPPGRRSGERRAGPDARAPGLERASG